MRSPSLLLPLLLLAASCDEPPLIRGTSILGDTRDQLGPYPVLTQVDDPDGLDGVWLKVTAGEQRVTLAMTELRAGLFEASIPGQPPFTRVTYFVEARDGEQLVTDPPGARDPQPDLLSFWVLGSSCQTHLECGSGQHCDQSRRCRQQPGVCAADADCGKGWRCGALQSCQPAVRRCQHDEGCLLGEVCDRWLGQCAPRPRCDLQPCPADFACEPASSLCRRACLASLECGPGERCQAGRCSGAQPCQTAASCPEGLACDPILLICRPEGAGLCAPCSGDQACGGPTDFCLVLGAAQVCGRSCSTSACPGGFACQSELDPPQCVPVGGACP